MKKYILILLLVFATNSCGIDKEEPIVSHKHIAENIDKTTSDTEVIVGLKPKKLVKADSDTVESKENTALDKVFEEYKKLDLNEQDIRDGINEINKLIEIKTSEEIMNTGDHSKCLTLADPDMEEACIMNVVQQEVFKTDDIAPCHKLYVTHKISSCQNAYYSYKAITAKDSSFCDKIIEKELREGLQSECRDNVMIEKVRVGKDLSLCENIVTASLKERCYSM